MPGRLALALKPSVRGSLRASLSIWVRNRLCLACMGVLLQAWSLAAAGTNTLPDDWVIRGWQTESGLPHNTVSALAQTRDGYLWAGTEGGLARFDGVEFRTFGLDDGLGSVRISKLFEDSQGVLWVGTEGGGLSRYEDGHFTTFTNRDGSVADTITALSEGVDGSLWVGTESGLYAWHDGVFTVPNGAVELQKRRVRALARDFSGKTWVSTLLEGLFQQTSGLFAPVRGEPPVPQVPVYSLLQSPDGALWAGGGNASLWRLRKGEWQRYRGSNGLPSSFITCLASGCGTEVWAGTLSDGLYFLDGDEFRALTTTNGLSVNAIQSLLVDREGALWVGTRAGGLNRITRRRVHLWGAREGLKQTYVQALAEDSAGCIWTGTMGGALYRFDRGQFTPAEDGILKQYPYVYSVLAVQDGSVWVGASVSLFHLVAGRVAAKFLKEEVGNQALTALCEDGGRIWIGTADSGLMRVSGTNLVWVATNGSFAGRITSLLREADDSLWVGSLGGLYRWEQGKVLPRDLNGGPFRTAVLALHRDSEGTLWVGTAGRGLLRLKDGRVLGVTAKEGLGDDSICQILSDDLGHLWLGSNRGLMRVAKAQIEDLARGRIGSIHAIGFGRNVGLGDEQYRSGLGSVCLRTRGGHLLFTTAKGIVEIDPAQWAGPARIPEIRIEEGLVDGEPQRLLATGQRTPALRMPPGDRRLEIHYSGIALGAPEWVHYRSRLDPLDKDWVAVGTRRNASYQYLRPGDYVFRVTACDEEGNWNPHPAALTISVAPYYWQTWWFRLMAVAALCAAAVSWYFWRVGKLESRRAAQEAFTRQLIQSQENERKRIAAELHDGLGQDLLLIKNRVGLLASETKDLPDVARQLGEVSRNTSRAIANVRAISRALRPVALEQVGLTRAVEWMVEQVSEASSVKFSTELEDIDGLLAPGMEINLYRIVQEALNNVLKHAQASQVIIEMKRQDPGIFVSILDNGRGFTRGPTGGDRDGGKPGLGLAGMAERAKVLGGRLDFQSATGKGTRITLRVPVPQPRQEQA